MKHRCVIRPYVSHFCSFCTCHADGWCEGAVEGGLGQTAWTWTLAPPLTVWLWPGNPSPGCCGSLVSETEILWSTSGMAWRIEWTQPGWCQSLTRTDFGHLPEPQGLGRGCHSLECALGDRYLCVRSLLWGDMERILTTWFFVPGRRSCCSVAKLCPALLTPWTAARQASLSFTISQSLFKLMSIELMMSSHPLLPPSPPALNLSEHQDLFQWVRSSHRLVKVCLSFSTSPSNEYSGLISFRIDWFDLPAIQGRRRESQKPRPHREKSFVSNVKQFLWHWIKKETPLFSFFIMVEHRFIRKTFVSVTVNSFTSPTYFVPFWILFSFFLDLIRFYFSLR